MRENLNRLPKKVQDLLGEAGRIASANNMPVYLVGGFVRDLLLGVKNLDLDIAVEGNGIKFAEDFASSLKAKLIRHKRFGTATIIVKPHLKIDPSTSSFDKLRTSPEQSRGTLRVNGERGRTIDIASARKEFYPLPAHLPVVSPGTLKDDLYRRDFTINAMAISISLQDPGRLIDFFGGAADLEDKKIRILHDLSFIDDPTRILRAVRFEKRYNFSIEPITLKKLKEAVKLKMLNRLEPQRMRDDLILMLKEDRPSRGIKRLGELAGFGFLSPHLVASQKTYLFLRSIEKQINWFKKIYPGRRHLDAWLIYFMGLIESLDINDLRRICRRFALRRGEEKRILSYKINKRKIIQGLNKKKLKPSKIFALFEPLSYETLLLLKAKYKTKRIQRHIEDFFKYYNGTRIFISGGDLGKLGLAPGPGYQKIFKKVLTAKLDGLVKTKEAELALVKTLIKSR
ncbi:MAG: CCA tRNA nucleotidyltransferase [Candidatus Omnitrophica bacterium]|nr:CCA tRNA nucleotidyltransferase [Candidatus Omnitrophota bacterium]